MAKIPKLTRSGMRLTKTMYVLKMFLFSPAIIFFHQNPSLVFIMGVMLYGGYNVSNSHNLSILMVIGQPVRPHTAVDSEYSNWILNTLIHVM